MLIASSSATPESVKALKNARTQFQKYLGAWAMDVLALKARGLDRPSRRSGARGSRARHKAARRAA